MSEFGGRPSPPHCAECARLPEGEREDGWAHAYWDTGYEWCDYCREWHRPRETARCIELDADV